MRAALALGHGRGRMLYELRPDLFPQGFLTETELSLWSRWYEARDNGRR